jgi:GNAT superfamily N-acetyltransferase
MIIRNSTPEDIPAIVTLLQLSLGEGLMKKSSVTWKYKHVDNPFGASKVLLAFEGDILVGVRAFMKWQWQLGTEVWTAYRAVDTATHPDYQGKGIFKKLTLQALDDIQEEGDTFVFNTPNEYSRPGYLKMGWQLIDAIELAVILTIFYVIPYFFSKVKPENTISTAQLNQLCIAHNLDLTKRKAIFTSKSVAYLKWRYVENPLQDYVIFSSNDWYMVFYIKKHRFFNELRVVETIGSNFYHKQMQKAILGYAFQKRCWVISTANKDLFGCKIYGKFGPKLTIKSFAKDSHFINTAYAMQNWEYSLGDLELF